MSRLVIQQAPELFEAPKLFTFTLTEQQRKCLAFAALCEADNLEEGYEADNPEVQEAIRSLWEAWRILEGRPT